MKAIIILFFCTALLPRSIYGDSSDNGGDDGNSDNGYYTEGETKLIAAQTKVNHIMEIGETINNVFKPLEYIGRGAYGFIYKGELTRKGTTKMVAMKFSPTCLLEALLVNEYDLYTYMKAVDNATVEDYGVPAVYYYGVWKDCTMLAITLLESPLGNIINAPGFELTDIDTFILFREYVRISKYMHSCGVCHDDTKLANIMFRKNQCFLIDFNTSRKVHSFVLNDGAVVDCRKKDWKQFLIAICSAYGIPFDLATPTNTLRILAHHKDPGLKRVFLKFAKYVFTDDLLDYDRMYAIITKEMHDREVQEPALVSWLNNVQQGHNQTPDIRSIIDPPANGQYDYPEPDYYHFINNN